MKSIAFDIEKEWRTRINVTVPTPQTTFAWRNAISAVSYIYAISAMIILIFSFVCKSLKGLLLFEPNRGRWTLWCIFIVLLQSCNQIFSLTSSAQKKKGTQKLNRRKLHLKKCNTDFPRRLCFIVEMIYHVLPKSPSKLLALW